MESLAKRVPAIRVSSVLLAIASWAASASYIYLAAVPEEEMGFVAAIFSVVGLIFYLVMAVTAGLIAWRWLRTAYIAAARIQPGGIGYRQGWTFWGWLTPVVSLWFPKKIIEACFGIFLQFSKKQGGMDTGFWWGTWIGANIVSWVSFRLSAVGEEGVATVFDVISSVLLTLSLPGWLKVVEQLSKAHDECIAGQISNPAPDAPE